MFTTYCNFPHRLKDGKPIGHECYIIPPAALQAERDGDMPRAIELIQAGKTSSYYGERSLPHHRGVRRTAICTQCRQPCKPAVRFKGDPYCAACVEKERTRQRGTAPARRPTERR